MTWSGQATVSSVCRESCPPGPTAETFYRRLEPPDINYRSDILPLFWVDAKLHFAPCMAYRVYDEFDQGCVKR